MHSDYDSILFSAPPSFAVKESGNGGGLLWILIVLILVHLVNGIRVCTVHAQLPELFMQGLWEHAKQIKLTRLFFPEVKSLARFYNN